MREQIIQAKKDNPSLGYRKIARLLGFPVSTVKYHLDPRQKEKAKLRKRRMDKTINGVFKRKKDNFQRNYEWQKTKRRENTKRRLSSLFTAEALKQKCLSHPFCYLTGRALDLTNHKNFELDHINPVSKGGDNSLENCGLTATCANRAKADLTIEEFLKLCKEILAYNGYEVKLAATVGLPPTPVS